MRTWRSNATVPASPAEVRELLTEPDAIVRWAPVSFELIALDGPRLHTGSHARVAGRLAGRSIEFNLDVLQASDERLKLVARGPISLRAEYVLRRAGDLSEIDASISVEANGPLGRMLAKATEALLAGGALHVALARLARELQPAPAS
jgi:Polyketide cyclase / dehydrase and lipid transport